MNSFVSMSANNLKNTYLFRLYHYDKKLFLVVLAFAGLTVFCNLVGKETTPFFVWGMYSEKFPPAETYDFLRTTINDSVLADTYAGFSDNTRAFLNAPLAYYRKIKGNGIDPTIPFLKAKLKNHYSWVSPFEKKLFNDDPQGFVNWYRCYLGQATGIDIRSLRVEILKTHFDGEQRQVLDSTLLLETWKQP
jgi:hypothetical protein